MVRVHDKIGDMGLKYPCRWKLGTSILCPVVSLSHLGHLTHQLLDHFHCLICRGKFFDNKAHAWNHLEKIHSNYNKVYCFECRQNYEHRFQLLEHYRDNHFYCIKCHFFFKDKYQIMEHMVNVHSKPTTFDCAHCDTIWESKEKLQIHNWTMHKYCVLCKISFETQADIAKHLVKTHQMKVKCEHCSFVSLNTLILDEHVRKNHKICNVCNEDAGSELKEHKRDVHFMCYICADKKFKNHSDILRHVEDTHYSKLLFRKANCPFCEVTLKNGARLKYHLYVKHHYCIDCNFKVHIFLSLMLRNLPKLY